MCAMRHAHEAVIFGVVMLLVVPASALLGPATRPRLHAGIVCGPPGVRTQPILLCQQPADEDEWSGLDEDFRTPGGEFELDLDQLAVLRDEYYAMRARHATGRANFGRIGVLDDPDSRLAKWWKDPLDGPEAAIGRQDRVRRFKRRLNMAFRPVYLAAMLATGALAPSQVARTSVRLGLLAHIAIPLLRLVAAKLSAAGGGGGGRADSSVARDLPFADATHILAMQHLLGSASVFAASALLWRGGAWFVSLVVASLGRLCLLPGLWYWRDLNAEIVESTDMRRRALYTATRAWRQLVTALCLVEAGLLLRLAPALDAVWVATPSLFAAAGGGTAAGSVLRALTPRLAGAAPSVLARTGPLFFGEPLPTAAAAAAAAASGSAPAMTPLVIGSLGAFCLFSYVTVWVAFPTEVFTRSEWRSSLQPKRTQVRTLAATLLGALGIARPSPTVKELLRFRAMRRAEPAERARIEGLSTFERERDDSVRYAWRGGLGVSDYIHEDSAGMLSELTAENNAPSDAMTADGTWPSPRRSEQGWEDTWGFMELARLFVLEDGPPRSADAPGREQGSDPVPEGHRWTRDEAQANLESINERRTTFSDTNRTNADLAELYFYKNTLRLWGEMRKPGRPKPKVTFISPDEVDEEEEEEEEAYDGDKAYNGSGGDRDGDGTGAATTRVSLAGLSPTTQRRPGGITEGYGASTDIDDLIAGDAAFQGADPSSLGEAAVAAPANVTLPPGIDDDERFV